MHQYWAFGLNINSEIEFPELLPHNFDVSDLTVTVGKAPEKLEGNDVINRVRVSASPREYLLNLDNIARYYVKNGNEIIVDPAKNTDKDSIRLFLLSNAMAAILHQQGKVPFHASGIITEHGVILFTGRSGTGKSTTVYGLKKLGYNLFTDDVCVLNFNDTTWKVEATPSYPLIKLWEDVIDEFATDFEKNYRVRPGLPKFGFFQHQDFLVEKQVVHKIFIFKTSSTTKDFSCTKLDKVNAFSELQLNTYRRKHVDMMQGRQPLFKMMSHLTNQVDTFEISRPEKSSVNSFISFVKDQLVLCQTGK